MHDSRFVALDALFVVRSAGHVYSEEVNALMLKLARADANPQITVAVRGRQIQCTHGNPFSVDDEVHGRTRSRRYRTWASGPGVAPRWSRTL